MSRRTPSTLRRLIRSLRGPVVPEDILSPHEKLKLASLIAGGLIVIFTMGLLFLVG